jgi:hypothetical protein
MLKIRTLPSSGLVRRCLTGLKTMATIMQSNCAGFNKRGLVAIEEARVAPIRAAWEAGMGAITHQANCVGLKLRRDL